MIKPRFRLTPEARELIANAERGVTNYKDIADRAAKAVADEAVKRVREVIMKQQFPNAFLSPGWAARKATRGLDPRVLMATKKYLDSYQVKKVSSGVYGIEAEGELMEILENRPPARPHWSTVAEEMKARAPQMMKDLVVKAILGG